MGKESQPPLSMSQLQAFMTSGQVRYCAPSSQFQLRVNYNRLTYGFCILLLRIGIAENEGNDKVEPHAHVVEQVVDDLGELFDDDKGHASDGVTALDDHRELDGASDVDNLRAREVESTVGTVKLGPTSPNTKRGKRRMLKVGSFAQVLEPILRSRCKTLAMSANDENSLLRLTADVIDERVRRQRDVSDPDHPVFDSVLSTYVRAGLPSETDMFIVQDIWYAIPPCHNPSLCIALHDMNQYRSLSSAQGWKA